MAAQRARKGCLSALKEDKELHAFYVTSFDEKSDPFLAAPSTDSKAWVTYIKDNLAKGRFLFAMDKSQSPEAQKEALSKVLVRATMYGRYITPHLQQLAIELFGKEQAKIIYNLAKE